MKNAQKLNSKTWNKEFFWFWNNVRREISVCWSKLNFDLLRQLNFTKACNIEKRLFRWYDSRIQKCNKKKLKTIDHVNLKTFQK
jgi:hypothetical protein